jgi:hypothetical protein
MLRCTNKIKTIDIDYIIDPKERFDSALLDVYLGMVQCITSSLPLTNRPETRAGDRTHESFEYPP